jgi:NADH-quinone oxidoreductase subunit N
MNAQMSELLYSLDWARPEAWVAGYALLGVLVGAWFKDRSADFLCFTGTLVFIVAGVLAMIYSPKTPQFIFGGSMVVDGFAAVVKALAAFSAAATLILGAHEFGRNREQHFEFPIMTALMLVGMFVMISANDLITLYVGVELQSLPSYVLAAWRRDDARSSEAGLKYFVLGAIASGLILFGASYIYGFTGSLRFTEIAQGLSAGGLGLLFGLVLLICGLGFKVSAAPFHMWTPSSRPRRNWRLSRSSCGCSTSRSWTCRSNGARWWPRFRRSPW